MKDQLKEIIVTGATEHNLKDLNISIPRNKITVVTGVSGSGKSSLVFDTILAESQRRFFYTLSHYSRQYLDSSTRPKVKKITGLSPAISLEQYETQFSSLATVGSLTDLNELLGVMFARFGEKFCPKHQIETTPLSIPEILEKIMHQFMYETIAFFVPVVSEKKGNFKTKLISFAKKGYIKAWIDGEILSLTPIPELNKEEKHTIKILVDHVTIKEGARDRLLRSLTTTLEEGEGYGVIIPLTLEKKFDLSRAKNYSTKEGCATCGYSWGRLDSRHFSRNSLGRCKVCQGKGVHEELEEALDLKVCTQCSGSGIDHLFAAIKIENIAIQHCHTVTIKNLHDFFSRLIETQLYNAAQKRVFEEIIIKLKSLLQVDLGYLQLSRHVKTLSGGESQRLRLSGVLTEGLRGVLYVMDEPSQGLHTIELNKIMQNINHLKQLGNTIIIVDHDEFVIKNADYVVDLGPGGGQQGGRIVAKFAPEHAQDFSEISSTAKYLCQGEVSLVKVKKHIEKFIQVLNLRKNNLKIDRARFVLNGLNVITGISGAGKTSLLLHSFYQSFLGINKETIIDGLEKIVSCEYIDRKPLAKTTVSMPMTYLDIFTDIRLLFEKLPESQLSGFTARTFSLNTDGGRCDECKGRGEILLSMKFLSDARIKCSVCDGARYKPHVQDIRYNGLSLSDTLNLTISEALIHFSAHPKIVRKLAPAEKLGIGYLKLGQTNNTLSGGEAQRLKLVPYLGKKVNEGTILIMDEPTLGLHFEDVHRLLNVFDELIDNGITLLVIEHNITMIRNAHWVVDLGPGSGTEGGQLLYEGLPAGLEKVDSPTGKVLRG